MFTIEPIAHVRASRQIPEDDRWGGTQAEIVLVETLDAAAIAGLDSFSHVEVLFVFDRVAPETIVTGTRHPRNNAAWPRVGILAQRGKNRPNRLGSTICRVVGVSGRVLTVRELDAIDGTPVVDIKPVLREFLPREMTTQPPWATELMTQYWADEAPPAGHARARREGGAPVVRSATTADLPAIVRLLADDTLRATRERPGEPLAAEYSRAFAAIQSHGGNDLLVATSDGEVVGCLQLTIIPGMSRLGAVRGQIEGVRVASSVRGRGIGEVLVRDAIERCRQAGCALVQLTSDVRRVDARRFYERLGFEASHIGMKLTL